MSSSRIDVNSVSNTSEDFASKTRAFVTQRIEAAREVARKASEELKNFSLNNLFNTNSSDDLSKTKSELALDHE